MVAPAVRFVSTFATSAGFTPRRSTASCNAPSLPGDDVGVQRVGPLREHRLSAPAHQDDPPCAPLGDHALGQLNDRRFVRLDARARRSR